MTFLDDMIARREASVAAELAHVARVDVGCLDRTARMSSDFAAVLRDRDDVAIIAEVKKASPSAGPIAPGRDAADQARAYERGGASAISVLTEPDVFGGSFTDLSEVTSAVHLPVLCKDFVVSYEQLYQAQTCGADAVLLMACVLGERLDGYLQRVHRLGLAALVEVANERELEAAREAGARIIGVNARDFTTLDVSLPRQRVLVAEAAATGAVVIAASGVTRREDVVAAARAGASAVLVGEVLMRAPVPEDAVRRLTGVRKEQGSV